MLPLTLEQRKASNQSICFPQMNKWVSKMPWHVGEPSQAHGEGASGQGTAWGNGSLAALPAARHHRHRPCQQVSFPIPSPICRQGEVSLFQIQKSEGFLQREKVKRPEVCNLLPAAALSRVRRWSHSLDPTRISGKQKSCCSPSTERRLISNGF